MVFQGIQKVFRQPQYLLLALIASAAVFAVAVWLPNLPLIVEIMRHSGISFSQKFNLLMSLLGSITTNFTLLSASYTIAIAVLFGMNIAMLVYVLRRRVDEVKHAGVATGLFGITSGVIGMGCAACGSFLLTSMLSFVGASGALAFLPLNGGEFGILGTILLGTSLSITAKKIQNPAICTISP